MSSIKRSIQALDLLARKGPLGVRAVAQQLSLPLGSVHRMLVDLEAEDVVERTPDGGVRPHWAGLLDALIWTESRYNPFAISRAGAAGLGQLMPGTAKELGVSNRFDPLSNLAGAARYLRQMLDRFGTVHMALAAYNAGPGAVERAGGIPLNGETPAYVRDVLRRWRP